MYLGNEESEFELELTWLKDHPEPYDLGEEEFHLAFQTDDFESAHAPVSYTHLDVYKRQRLAAPFSTTSQISVGGLLSSVNFRMIFVVMEKGILANTL